jgi:very-short-patch-repair endonuclease
MAREGEDGRRKLVEAAHKARTGAKASLEEKLNRARRRSTEVGYGEREVMQALQAHGIKTESQWPCGPYNIDIACGSIAVELLTRASNPLNDPEFIERSKYLCNAGYCLILVRFRVDRTDDVIANLDHIVAFIERANLDPSMRSKNWVIRCSSERFARGRNDRGQVTAVPTPIRFFHIISEWYL